MEEALGAALAAGISETEFWDQTPYLTHLTIRAKGKRTFEVAMMTGWWSERFAREERLSGLPHYMNPVAADAVDDGDALIASFGMMHGLQVDDIEDSEETG